MLLKVWAASYTIFICIEYNTILIWLCSDSKMIIIVDMHLTYVSKVCFFHLCVCPHSYVCMHICVPVCLICVFIVCMYVCLCVCVSLSVCLCVFVCVCAHLIYLIYIDTPLHKATSSSFEPTKSKTTVSEMTVSTIIPGKLLP